MFDKTGVNILGLIDNMSYFKGDDGKDYQIFGESGVEKTAKEFNKKFLGHLPIHQDLRSSADKGDISLVQILIMRFLYYLKI